ncbi:hypothetical protein [Nocardioides sp.]|uniref:hypothetical protein n=1 Tax=Nocardioides sp. TaxID=35761 RepID=UPI0026236857|nr:hypothetical protein [Nocardioides sp.]MCW2735447.1 hypothetical protein [Nocardioides sp.]
MTTAAEQQLESRISVLRDEIAEREAEIAERLAELRPMEQTLAFLRGEKPTPARSPVPDQRARRRRGARTTLILELLAGAPDGMTRSELAKELGEEGEEDLLSNGLSYLKRNGKVRRSADGRWSLPQ